MDHDRYCDVKWAHILGDMGRYHPISGDIRQYRGNIGRYWAILGQFLVVSRPSCVESGPIQVVPGQLILKPSMVRPCRICTVTISLKMTDIGRYRCIVIYIAHICSAVQDSAVQGSDVQYSATEGSAVKCIAVGHSL